MTPSLPRSLASVLDGSTPAGVLSWPADRPLEQALSAARTAGWSTAVLDLEGVADKAEFMDRCARSLRLPAWFGRNWDALADCLTDLSWCPAARGRLLVMSDWQGYAAAEPDEWGVAEGVVADAVAYWRDTDTGLTVLMTRGRGQGGGQV
ncbi:barstar family protein [Streptomyces sp. MST-110588]|uniref:barstar family protein n=1 Tax=Streptomyces sp. MST-110588 TaxID=2833628 RepID=UPI001F5DE071|nr:barstar family protein [Streptomyces sp. MST-110588]UNO38965.1 barstar family protein [Streptomyces sp. MST-110588]